ncbi:MAG: cytochrome P460 family protein [Deltaproteobacteria bacterium]|nr:cytochrome P460 family protein [Deltaproteobacteria bacterium]
MNFPRLAALGFAALLFACGGSQDTNSSSSAAANPCAANPCAANPCAANPCGGGGGTPEYQLPVDLSTWNTWTKASSETFLSSSHSKAMVDVYVTTDHADAYKALKGPMPVGMALVKAQHKNDGGQKGAPQNLTVMVKMEAGFDPDNGDWYYGVYSYDGKKVMMEGKADGKTAMCANCHDTADTDYVFGSK